MLEILGIFDWISPTTALAREWFGGQTPISVFWDNIPPVFYEELLNERGIAASSGSVVAGSGFVILVPDGDEQKARKILEKEGAWLA